MPDESPERAILVSIQLPGVSDPDHEADLAELRRLVKTLGCEVVGHISQKRDALAHGAVLGEGKLRELARATGGSGTVEPEARHKMTKARVRWAEEAGETDDSFSGEAFEGEWIPEEDADSATSAEGSEEVDEERRPTLVVVNHEISPSQARNLERATGAAVTDRTGVIVDIFHRHAHSREARLQVEIARLTYVSPRIRETGRGKGERKQGQGAGESALELDRRKIRDRIAELREEIEAIQRDRGNRRASRSQHRRVALVGYTNAGKSSLMRALTGSEVYVADKLFATLDTTVRALHPAVKPRILVSDTVGFIKNLPHDLVASFRSTLDEALEASLLLQVLDASDSSHRAQFEVTQAVLAEIGATEVPRLLILNKSDRLDQAARDALQAEYPKGLLVSAKEPEGVNAVRQSILQYFDSLCVNAELMLPYGQSSLLGAIHESVQVQGEKYDEVGALLSVRGESVEIERLRALIERGASAKSWGATQGS